FVETDLARLSTPQSSALKADVIDFLGWQNVPELWREQELTLPNIAAVQGVVRFTLHQFILENRRIEHGGFPTVEDWNAEPRERPGGVLVSAAVSPETGAAAAYTFIVSIENGNVVFHVQEPGNVRPHLLSASLKESFLFALGVSLSKVNVRYFRECLA